MIGLKHNNATNTTTAGKYNTAGLTYLGQLSGEKPMHWCSVMLEAGIWSMYTDGTEMYIFPDQ